MEAVFWVLMLLGCTSLGAVIGILALSICITAKRPDEPEDFEFESFEGPKSLDFCQALIQESKEREGSGR
jgi:hypothetical protein